MSQPTITDKIISEVRTNPDSTATKIANAINVEPSTVSSVLYRLYKNNKIIRSMSLPWRYRAKT